MNELDFVREAMLQEAWEDVQWNFLEDVERETERRVLPLALDPTLRG